MADNTGQELMSTAYIKARPTIDKCLIYGEDYVEKERNRSTLECELIFLPTPINGAQSIDFLVLQYTINTYNGPLHENVHKRSVQPATSSEL